MKFLRIGTQSECITRLGANGNSNGSSTSHSECDSMRNKDNGQVSTAENHQLARNNNGPQGTFYKLFIMKLLLTLVHRCQ